MGFYSKDRDAVWKGLQGLWEARHVSSPTSLSFLLWSSVLSGSLSVWGAGGGLE